MGEKNDKNRSCQHRVIVFLKFHPVDFNGACHKPAFSLLTSFICHYECTAMYVVLLRVTTGNLTAVDVKDMNKNYVNSGS